MLRTFIYSVLDSFGQEIKGVLSAESYEEALSKLRNQGYIVLELKEKSDKKAFFPFRKKFGIQESIVGFLHDEYSLQFNQIASLLKRNYQTIRTAYLKFKEKGEKE